MNTHSSFRWRAWKDFLTESSFFKKRWWKKVTMISATRSIDSFILPFFSLLNKHFIIPLNPHREWRYVVIPWVKSKHGIPFFQPQLVFARFKPFSIPFFIVSFCLTLSLSHITIKQRVSKHFHSSYTMRTRKWMWTEKNDCRKNLIDTTLTKSHSSWFSFLGE